MPNASPADARAGYALFRENPDTDLDRLNTRLERQGHNPVSARMLQHYRSLFRAGFERYVSINRFDVARAARPYEGLSANPRYFYFGSQVDVSVQYTKAGKDYALSGVAERVGEVGALIRFKGDALDQLRRQRPTVDHYVTIEFRSPVQDRALARVIELELGEDSALLDVEFSRLRPVSLFTATEPLPGKPTTITVEGVTADDLTADLIGRRIYYTFEAIESCRAIANEILRTDTVAPNQIIDPPQVQLVRVESPLVVVIVAPPVVATTLGVAWLIVRSGFRTWANFYAKLQSAKVDSAMSEKIRAEARKVEAEAETLEIENEARRRELLFGVARSELESQTALADATDLTEADEDRRNTLASETSESVSGLERQGVDDVEIKADPSEAA